MVQLLVHSGFQILAGVFAIQISVAQTVPTQAAKTICTTPPPPPPTLNTCAAAAEQKLNEGYKKCDPKRFENVFTSIMENGFKGESTASLLSGLGSSLAEKKTGNDFLGMAKDFGNLAQCGIRGSILSMDACPAEGAEIPDPTCDLLSSTSGQYSKDAFKNFQKEINKSKCAVACRMTKIEAAEKMVQCLNSAATEVDRELNECGKTYTEFLRVQKEYSAQCSEVLGGFAKQKGQLQKYLSGDKETGRKGLKEVGKELTQMLSKGIPDMRKRLTDHMTKRDAQAKEFETKKAQIYSSKVMGCVARQQYPGSTADARAGKTVDLATALALQYASSARYAIGKDGRATKTTDTNKANAKMAAMQGEMKAKIDALMNRLKGSIGGGEKGQVISEKNVLKEIEKLIDQEMKGQSSFTAYNIDASGKLSQRTIDVKQFIKTEMSKCDSEAKTEFKSDASFQDLSQKHEASIKAAEAEIQQVAEAMDHSYRDQIESAFNALGEPMTFEQFTQSMGGGRVLTNERCMSNAESAKECMDAFKNGAMKILHNGMIDKGGMPMIPLKLDGTPGRLPDFNIQCKGLNDCITKLENHSKQIDTEVDQSKGTKALNERNVNGMVEAELLKLGTLVSKAGSQIKGGLDFIRKALSKVGGELTGLVPADGKADCGNAKMVDAGDKQVYGELKDLPGSDVSFSSIANCRGRPPMPNLGAGGEFANLPEKLGGQIDKLKAKLDKVSMKTSRLAEVNNKCVKADNKAEIEALTSLTECGAVKSICESNDGVSELQSDLIAIMKNPSVAGDKGLVKSLRAGMGFCKNVAKTGASQSCKWEPMIATLPGLAGVNSATAQSCFKRYASDPTFSGENTTCTPAIIGAFSGDDFENAKTCYLAAEEAKKKPAVNEALAADCNGVSLEMVKERASEVRKKVGGNAKGGY